MSHAPKKEDGNASVAVVASVLFVMIFFLGLADLGIFLVARARAQTAADAAALAAAIELRPGAEGRSPAGAAERFARLNGTEVVSCDCRLGRRSVTVKVRGSASFLIVRAAGVEEVTARASAEVDTGILGDSSRSG